MAILKFHTPSCGQCRVVDQIIKKQNIPHQDIDCTSDEGEELAKKYNITHVPTIVIVNNDGTEYARYSVLPAIIDFLNHYQ